MKHLPPKKIFNTFTLNNSGWTKKKFIVTIKINLNHKSIFFDASWIHIISLLTILPSYDKFWLVKFTIVAIKFSLIMTDRIERHSLAFSCNNKQTDSSAILTLCGGLAIDLTSTRCCFLIDLTATHGIVI